MQLWPAQAQTVTIPPEKLNAPQALPDVVQGKADAPVTIIEYASMTCPHCARFHAETYPTLLSKYIETGKVRFHATRIPARPARVARPSCWHAATGDGDKRTAVIDLLFNAQQSWAYSDTPIDALAGLMKQTGMGDKDSRPASTIRSSTIRSSRSARTLARTSPSTQPRPFSSMARNIAVKCRSLH